MEGAIEVLPGSLEEAIDILLVFFREEIALIKGMTEKQFRGSMHHSSGQFIRNSWQLWWYKGHTFEGWDKEQPKLNAWFESIGITHADDMSGILMTCLYRKVKGLDYGLDEQVAVYHKHWKEQGYPDGIPRHK